MKNAAQTRTTIRRGVLESLITDEKVSSRKSVASMADAGTRAKNGLLLGEISLDVPTAPINGFASLVNYAPSSDRPIHRWFWYREGYSQELVDEFIKDLPRGSVVLDPFCGAGTSLLAARERGLPSVGFDVNPISTLVSKVKTTPLKRGEFELLRAEIERLSLATAALEADPKPVFKIIDKVFDADVLNALLIFRRLIKGVANENVRDLVFVAWLSIIEKVSNVYKEGNGIKYKNRKRTDDGYIRVDLTAWQAASLPVDKFLYVQGELISKVEAMVGDLRFMPEKSPSPVIYESSAETLSGDMSPNSVSLTIFSPPYCNCFNYFKMYKVELWMGGFVSSYEELRKLNRRGLRSHVETILKRDNDVVEPVSEKYAQLLDGVKLWDKRIPNAVRGYFIDMAAVLGELYKVLKPSGKCVIIIGNSAYGGVVIPTDAILAKIAENLGFKVEKLAVARHLTTSSQQRAFLDERVEYLRESILVLVKEDPRLVDRKLEMVDEIPERDDERDERFFLIKNAGLTAGTHKFHRYPGKFIPHIPRWAIQRHIASSSGSVVLDPFCGSGTTLVEAKRHGAPCFGIDVDPIARLVSRVKASPIPRSTIDELISDVTKKLARRKRGHFRPAISTLNHWFNEPAINDLGLIRDIIDEYRGDPRIYEFLLVCFAAIIRRVSNADNQTQKTYVSHTKPKTPDPACPLFLSVLRDYGGRIAECFPDTAGASVTVIDGCDALNFADYWVSNDLPSIDIVVTSPPYLNSVDYVYNQMAEYFWIGDLFGLEDQKKQNEHKRRYVGTTKVDVAQYSEPLITGLSAVDRVASRVRDKSKKNGYIVEKYFSDMRTHFEQAVRILKPGGRYISVVGDSLISGEPIIVNELVIGCAQAAGLMFERRFGYEIRNRHMRFPRMGRGGIVRYDWVLEFMKV